MRKTKIRADLISLFDKEHTPTSAPELLSLLSKNHPTINKTTVYRELSFLKTQGFIKEVLWNDGLVRFEKKSAKCHHHLVCDNCGLVQDVVVGEEEILAKIQKKSNFKIKSHSIEFFGLCSSCK